MRMSIRSIEKKETLIRKPNKKQKSEKKRSSQKEIRKSMEKVYHSRQNKYVYRYEWYSNKRDRNDRHCNVSTEQTHKDESK